MKPMMRRKHGTGLAARLLLLVFPLLLIVAIGLTSCAAVTPTVQPTPTTSPIVSPTATPSPGPTAIPDPRPLISTWAVRYLCAGLADKDFDNGASTFGLDGSIADYRLEDGKTLHIEWQDLVMSWSTFRVIRSYRIEGSAEVVASTEPMPFDDSTILWNGTSVKLGKGATYDAFVNAMGPPTTDEMNDTDEGKERILTYPDAKVYMVYSGSIVTWADMDASSAKCRTPRGLQVGLTASRVLPLFATGAFAIDVKDDGGGLQRIVVIKKTGGIFYIYFSEGVVSRIEFR